MGHSYEDGRLNLPFVGIATFGKNPYVSDWSNIDADAAIIGAPFDSGAQYRSGARFGPRSVREASTLFSFGHAGAYDHEDDITYLDNNINIVDMGDADIIHTNTKKSHENIEIAVRAALKSGAIPVTIGGDHSINIPCINAFDDQDEFHILQIDAHLDFVDERHGVRFGHGNPMRRAAEKKYVRGMSQFGIRNVSSTAKSGYEDAKKMGCFVVGLDGESDVTLSEMKVATEPIMIVVGSEGKGLSRLVREKCDLVVSIPMNATTESLNASVATSIALFWVDEARRKK